MGSIITLENKIYTTDVPSLRPNRPEYLIMHATRLYPEFDDILKYHKSIGWAGVGYHLLVSSSNKIYQARPFDKEGAHALGFNTNSIGLCFYAQNMLLDRKKVQIGKELITMLKELYPSMQIISHTLAQVICLNMQFKKAGIEKRLPETQEVVNEELFQKIKTEINSITGSLETSKHYELKQSLKSFRNCPGEMFNHFI